jgi:hypothetical protein
MDASVNQDFEIRPRLSKKALFPAIGSIQMSDLPMSGLKEVDMAKKKTAKKKAKK